MGLTEMMVVARERVTTYGSDGKVLVVKRRPSMLSGPAVESEKKAVAAYGWGSVSIADSMFRWTGTT